MTKAKRGVDAFCGNMPFLGGTRIATHNSDRYAEWLTEMHQATGRTDYVGYFFHRAQEMLAPAGTVGLIATNAISDGDNRRVVLGRLLKDSFRIYGAGTGLPWPGNAQVLIATLFIERGLEEGTTHPVLLNGRPVRAINSRLRSGEEWPEPEALPENAGKALAGCFLRGTGFILTPEEAEGLLEQHPEEDHVVRPFLTGDDLSNAPDHQPSRYVIDFADMTLEQARTFPAAMRIIEERVRPGRERLRTTGADAEHRKYWWRFANVRLELRQRSAELPRLLATARVSKHSTFAFVSPTWTPSEQVVVFPLATWTAFAVLQSRLHSLWVSFQATHMGEGLRYSGGDCFGPFPFPGADPSAVIPELESIGEQLYKARADLMKTQQIGLTGLYNQLNDPSLQNEKLQTLRLLHEELDRAVLHAYGWDDIQVPAFGVQDPDFEDAVAGQLFALNAQRRAARPGYKKSGPKKAQKTAGPGVRKTSVKKDNNNNNNKKRKTAG